MIALVLAGLALASTGLIIARNRRSSQPPRVPVKARAGTKDRRR